MLTDIIFLTITPFTGEVNRYKILKNKKIIKTHTCIYGGLDINCNRQAELELFRNNPPNELSIYNENADNSDDIKA